MKNPLQETRRHRAIFLSDVHLGLRDSRADLLLEFLRANDADRIYLIGDIIDTWRLKRGWYWPQSHNDVVQKILKKVRKGTRVIYIPGNHDEAFRDFVHLVFGGVMVLPEATYYSADGKRLWITHGDQFDGVLLNVRWLEALGNRAYDLALLLNRWFNFARRKLGYPYWSLSSYLKHKVKNAVKFIAEYEATVVRETRRRGFDGVVCGHIHRAEIRDIDGLLYANSGDWVESCTALVETWDGHMKIVPWTEASPMLLQNLQEIAA